MSWCMFCAVWCSVRRWLSMSSRWLLGRLVQLTNFVGYQVEYLVFFPGCYRVILSNDEVRGFADLLLLVLCKANKVLVSF